MFLSSQALLVACPFPGRDTDTRKLICALRSLYSALNVIAVHLRENVGCAGDMRAHIASKKAIKLDKQSFS